MSHPTTRFVSFSGSQNIVPQTQEQDSCSLWACDDCTCQPPSQGAGRSGVGGALHKVSFAWGRATALLGRGGPAGALDLDALCPTPLPPPQAPRPQAWWLGPEPGPSCGLRVSYLGFRE